MLFQQLVVRDYLDNVTVVLKSPKSLFKNKIIKLSLQ